MSDMLTVLHYALCESFVYAKMSRPNFGFKTAAGSHFWQTCDKNPGHKDFIPVKEFNKSHLPLEYQNKDVVMCVRALSDLAVRVIVTYVSEKRQPGDIFYNMRGREFCHTGSGTVVSIQSSRFYPTRAASADPLKKIWIETARHVVFDDSEACRTTVDLFYDDDLNEQNIRQLHGSKVIYESEKEDRCIFECVTRDRDLVRKLRASRESLDSHRNKLKKFTNSETKLAIIASHPHGCSKHITVGMWRTAQSTSRSSTEATSNLTSWLQPVIDGDKVILKIPLIQGLGHIVSGKPEEAEVTGIEVYVEFPDGTSTKYSIWQLDRPVKETKSWLLTEGGVCLPPESLEMVVDLPGGITQVLQDEENINYYWDDLTSASRLRFDKKQSLAST